MFIKYPRTPHLEGSRLQPGDTDADQVLLINLTQGNLVWEEKVDGANCGISFDEHENLVLQSRGHVLTGGAREAQFNLFKTWATSIQDELYCILGDRYVVYGEWCFAKHSVFYDLLPHYFMEFDVYDRHQHTWLDTPNRYKLLEELPIHHVPVVHQGHLRNRNQIEQMLKPSLYKSENWRANLQQQAHKHQLDAARILSETDSSDLSEGFYIKQELNGEVIGRYKFVRHSFVQTILDSGTHWADRPILPNMMDPVHALFGNTSHEHN